MVVELVVCRSFRCTSYMQQLLFLILFILIVDLELKARKEKRKSSCSSLLELWYGMHSNTIYFFLNYEYVTNRGKKSFLWGKEVRVSRKKLMQKSFAWKQKKKIMSLNLIKALVLISMFDVSVGTVRRSITSKSTSF